MLNALLRFEDWVARQAERLPLWAARAALAAAGVSLLAMLSLLIAGHGFMALWTLLIACVAALSAAGGYQRRDVAESLAQQAQELLELRCRLDVLEPTVELHSAQANLSATLVDDLSHVIEGRLAPQSFPRLVMPKAGGSPPDASMGDPVESAAAPPIVEQPVPEEPRSTKRRIAAPPEAPSLRDAFVASIRAGDFARALAQGEHIVTVAPQSRMAADFLALRPYLQHRAKDEPSRRAQ